MKPGQHTPNRPAPAKDLREVLIPVATLTAIFYVNFAARQLAGPTLPALAAELGLNHSQSGFLILLLGSGFCLSQLGAAYLAARLGLRRCILISLWATAAAAATVSRVDSAWAMSLCFLALGMAGGLYIPSGISLITSIVSPRDWGKAMGVHEMAPNLALITVPLLANGAVLLGSWRLGYDAVAGALLLLGGVYVMTGPDTQRRPDLPDLLGIRRVIGRPVFWKISTLLSLAVGVETGVYSLTPLYLVSERGFELAEANRLLALSRIPGFFLVLISGWLTDLMSPTRTIRLSLGTMGAALTLLALGPDWLLGPCLFIQAAACACLFPPILSMVSASSTDENRVLMLSLSVAIAPLAGSGLIPAAIAAAGDLWSLGIGLAATGILIIAGIGLTRS